MIGFLIEHYAGNFPVWLAPQQVAVIPITDTHNDYALRLAAQMKAAVCASRPISAPTA